MAKLGRDNQLDRIVSMVNVAHAQKYNMVTKNGCNRPKTQLKSKVRDLECHNVACQVLPHLVYAKRTGTRKNSKEG